MADLNAGLILEGVDTTHPVMAIDEGTQLQRAADTVQTQAQTQQTKASTNLTGLQAQALALQNQQAQIQMQGAQQYAKALAQVSARIRAGATAPATPAATDTSSPAPGAAPVGTGTVLAPTDQSTTPAGSSSASGNLPGTQNVLPDGVDPSWKINKATDWYTDEDGNPISHYTGPAMSPSGRVNMHSAQVQDQIADVMQQGGANPAFIAQMRLSGEQKAQDLDKANVGLYEDMQKGQEAAAAAKASQQKVAKDVQEHVANLADFDLQQPNPQAAFMQSVGQNPKMFDAIMKAAVKPGDPPISDPNDPRILPILKGLQSQSPAFLERTKAMDQGVHMSPISIDPRTGAQVPGQPFRIGADGKVEWITGSGSPALGGGGSTAPPSTSTTTPAAPAVGPAEADTKSGLPLYARRQIDALGTFQADPKDLPENPRGGAIPRATILANMSKYYPGYDAGQAPTAIAAEKDYGAGGASGKTLVNAETAYSHANIVGQLAAAAKPDGSLPDVPWINALKNKLSTASGGAPVNNLNDIMELYATEQAKFIEGGAPSVSGIQAQRDKLNAAMSNGSIAGVLATNQAAAVEKAKAMKDSYLGSFPGDPTSQARVSANFDRKIPNLAPVIAKQGDAASIASDIAAAKLPKPSAAQTAKAPTKAGDMVTDSKGNTYAYKGSGDIKDIKNYVLVK